MTLTLQTRDGEIVEQWDIAQYGDLARFGCQRALINALLDQLERAAALEKLRGFERAKGEGVR